MSFALGSILTIVFAMLALAAAVYLRGWRRLHALRPDLYGPRPLLAYLGGLATLAVAIGSPLEALADLLLVGTGVAPQGSQQRGHGGAFVQIRRRAGRGRGSD